MNFDNLDFKLGVIFGKIDLISNDKYCRIEDFDEWIINLNKFIESMKAKINNEILEELLLFYHHKVESKPHKDTIIFIIGDEDDDLQYCYLNKDGTKIIIENM